MRDAVFVLTADAERDPCIVMVRAAMEARGATLTALSAAGFPGDLPLRLSLDATRTDAALGPHDLGAARSLWVRDLSTPQGFPEGMRADHRAAAAAQSDAALSSLFGCFPGFVLDPIEALSATGYKPRVQQLAARVGLDVPRTLVTNDPEAAAAFVRAQKTGAICKLIDSGSVGLEGSAFPTTEVTPDDLEHLGGLRLSPMIFQEKLAKELELRITVVGAEVFVAAVAPGDAVDVRMDPALVRGYRAYDGLPDGVRSGLLRLLDRLRLNFATADLVKTPGGRWVLLEVNSVSFFDHVERYAGLPISGAVADLLLGRAPPRVVPY